MNKRGLILGVMCCVALMFASCHKVCTCTDYGGREREFTADEVDDHAGGNCSEMVNFPILNHYSYCHW
ncbi:MAG: hypothetical protein IJ524_02985 [Bacteroidales bacterium]|nr:hypothetical protein [Bacteroidales bacterium]